MGLRFNKTFSRSISALAVFAGAMFISANAIAAPLAPGGTVAPTGTGSPAGAALVVDSGAQPFASVDGTSFSGTLRTRVYNQDAGNPFGANALTFTFVLTNNGPDSLERLVTINYGGYQTNANFNNILVPGLTPSSVDRSANGKVVGWDYTNAGGVAPGGTSSMLVLYTNAIQFVPATNSIINGSVATVPSFGPLPIPEPATLGLASIAGLGLLIRRRSN
ncbi:hypothetical protein BH09PLA1_BH09PLA1_06170 [soil metagenome]